MRVREIVALRGTLKSEAALEAALPWPWKIIYVQDILGAVVLEANAPDHWAPELLRQRLDAALNTARATARAA